MHLPIHFEDGAQNGKLAVAWDFNLLTLDGYSPETWWIRIDTSSVLEEKLGGEEGVAELDPSGSSTFGSRCGWQNKDLNGTDVYECGRCGLRIDR